MIPNIDSQEFEKIKEIADKIRENKFKLEVELKISKSSPNRQFKSVVSLMYKPYGFKLTVLLHKKWKNTRSRPR